MKLVWLFGAGASFGAFEDFPEGITPHLPPLMHQLYDRLAERFPDTWGAGTRLGDLSEGFRTDFEGTFAREILHADHSPPLTPSSLTLLEAQVPLARYFAAFQPVTADNLYSRVLAAIERAGLLDDCVFGSLNYDTLFEQAALDAGFGVDWLLSGWGDLAHGHGMTQGEQGGRVTVAKLHGSSNFVAEVPSGYSALIAAGTAVEARVGALDPRRDLAADLELRFNLMQRGTAQPVMSQISPAKETLISEGQIGLIRQYWEEQVRSARTLIIVGAAPRPGDVHVWTPVRDSGARLLYVGRDFDFRGWATREAGSVHLGRTFSEAFDGLLREIAG